MKARWYFVYLHFATWLVLHTITHTRHRLKFILLIPLLLDQGRIFLQKTEQESTQFSLCFLWFGVLVVDKLGDELGVGHLSHFKILKLKHATGTPAPYDHSILAITKRRRSAKDPMQVTHADFFTFVQPLAD